MNKDRKYKAIIYQYYKTNIPLDEGHIDLYLHDSERGYIAKFSYVYNSYIQGKNTYKELLYKLMNKFGYNIVEIEFKTMHLDDV